MNFIFQPEDMRRKYSQMKDLNEHLLKQLETGRQELDRLTLKQKELEEVSGFRFRNEVIVDKIIEILLH